MKNQKLMFLFTAVALVATQSIPTTRAETSGALRSNSQTNQPIPWSEVGTKATAQYSGEGLTVFTDPRGAVRLRCAFQRLEGEATDQGLWLTSAVEGQAADRFRVVADFVGRSGGALVALPEHGVASCDAGLAHFSRRGLREEYSMSVDGVRQDFVVLERPSAMAEAEARQRPGVRQPSGAFDHPQLPKQQRAGALQDHSAVRTVSGEGAAAVGEGGLRVELAVSGAKAQPLAQGAQLVLGGSGRELAYSRLRVTDANGKELPAQLKVVSDTRLAVVVDDAGAAYPVRIDPTFSDANWVSMGEVAGAASAVVRAAVVDGAGNLYIGGAFTSVAGVSANAIAKWNGRAWSALGSGLGFSPFPEVYAMAVSGSNLYVGGYFDTAGGIPVNSIAKWNGNSWSALGEEWFVYPSAMVVAGTDLYVGGGYSTDSTGSGDFFSGVAKWNGSSWSGLSIGAWRPDNRVLAVAVSGNTVYVGGHFTSAGGVPASCVAKWNGSSWSGLGLGLGAVSGQETPAVWSLAFMGGDLFAGGTFTTAGLVTANRIARWNGTEWSTLVSGIDGMVYAMAVAGNDLYVGGRFTKTFGKTVNSIAKWDGNSWSAMGSGLVDSGEYPGSVWALVALNSDLYVGGDFTRAGGKVSPYLARAYLIAPPGGIADAITAAPGTANIKFYGNPGHQFDVLRATNLTPPVVWTTLNTNPLSPAADGVFTFTDTAATNGMAYYRSVEK